MFEFTDTHFHVSSCWVDPSRIVGNADLFSIETEVSFIFRLSSQSVDGKHQIYAEWADDTGQLDAHVELITAEPHVWEVLGSRAETAASRDGAYMLLIDGVAVDRREKVENFDTWGRATVAKYDGQVIREECL